MGKATRWFKGLFGTKKGKEIVDNNSHSSERVETTAESWFYDADAEKEHNKHAIAVAAATAAAADAAVAAAQAAVEVVRLTTSQGRRALFNGGRGKLAATKIQAVFRGYLARKARRALSGLVKLQALVRGYLVRKRAAATMRSMQALFRAQTVVRSQRSRRAGNNNHKCRRDARPRKSVESSDENMSVYHSNRLSASYYDHSVNAFDESPKIVEIDTFGPKSRSRRVNSSILDYGEKERYHTMSTPHPCQFSAHLSIQNHHHLQDFDWALVEHDSKFATAHSTPRLAYLNRANELDTPAKRISADGLYAAYANSPSYMANTQSFRAKLRSHSAPKQRPEIMGSKKKFSLHEIMESRTSFSGVRMQKCSQVHEEYEC